MRIFKNTWFNRFANKERILDEELREMVNWLEADQVDANLGGVVYKVRTARPGEGKFGGYRVIVFFRSGERTFFYYGFPKSKIANISHKERKVFRETAKEYFSMTPEQIKERIDLFDNLEI